MYTNSLVKAYMKLTIKTPIIFILYLLIFISVILMLTLHEEVDIISTYNVKIETLNDKSYISFDKTMNSNLAKVYLYEDKNKDVYEVNTINNINTDNMYQIVPDNTQLRNFLLINEGKEIKVDIPQGKTTLFKRIFLKGGKS